MCYNILSNSGERHIISSFRWEFYYSQPRIRLQVVKGTSWSCVYCITIRSSLYSTDTYCHKSLSAASRIINCSAERSFILLQMKTILLTIRGVSSKKWKMFPNSITMFTPSRCEDNNIRSIVSKQSNKGQVLRPVVKKL